MNDDESKHLRKKSSVGAECAALLKLAWPLIVNNLALAGMSFADATMAGQLSPQDLAAVAVGSAVWMLHFLFGMGILMALSPLIAHSYGARKFSRIGSFLRQGFWIAAVIAIAVIMLIRFGSAPFLAAIQIDPEFRDRTVGYVWAIVWGAPAILAFLVLRFTSEALGKTLPIMVATLTSLCVNVVGNYVFMYGKLGFPEMGAVGCGVASAISMWFMFGVILLFVLFEPSYRPLKLFSRFEKPDWMIVKRILSLGLPICTSVIAEAGLFVAVALLMGTLSTNIAAAHQIAINYASTMFMVPLAINSAMTVRVGMALGEKRKREAHHRGVIGIYICTGFMICSAVFLLTFREFVVGLYTSDADVTAIAVSLLFMAGVFQVSDGLQVAAAGALRGFHDTRVPMLINVISYWVIGFPLAWYAARNYIESPSMVWGGLVAGLTVAAVLLLIRYARISRVDAE